MKRNYQLIVVGAGPAGFCAGIAAARMGIDVLLVEQYGILGGAMTIGGVPFPMTFATNERQVVAGIGWELMERLLASGWASGRGGCKEAFSVVDVDPVMTACEMDQMAEEAGLKILLNCKLCKAVSQDGRVNSASFAGPEGLIELSADMWIDATGDGQLSALAGAAFEMGDAETGEVQPGSLGFWIDGYDSRVLNEKQIADDYFAARKKGELKPGDYYGENNWGIKAFFEGHGLNKNHVDIQEVSAVSRTAAALEGHKRIKRIMNWAKHEVAQTTNIYGCSICPEAWPRESRRILGKAYVTEADYRAHRKYDDGICLSYYPIDVHKKPKEGEENFHCETLSKNDVSSIPLGALIVRDFDNLLVAGRCISGDHMAQSAYRVQAPCMAMGEAAGTAAAIQLRKKEDMSTVCSEEVRKTLSEHGAIIPE